MRNLIYFFLLIPVSVFSQYSGKITYLQNLNLIKSEEYSGETTLLFNKENSSYIQENLPSEGGVIEEGNTLQVLVSDKEGLPVYINRNEKIVMHKTTYGLQKVKCVYYDTLKNINWKLYDEQKKIGNYICQKALGDFGGRTYEAWFTTTIPVSTGPYKLWGLPGIILEAKSIDGMVSFLLKKLVLTKQSITIEKPTSKKIYQSKKEYINAIEKYNDNLLKRTKSMGINLSINPIHPDSKIEKVIE